MGALISFFFFVYPRYIYIYHKPDHETVLLLDARGGLREEGHQTLTSTTRRTPSRYVIRILYFFLPLMSGELFLHPRSLMDP